MLRQRHPSILLFVTLLAAPLGSGCAEDLSVDDPDPSEGADTGQTHTHTDGEVQTTVVDATDAVEWVYFDFDTGAEVDGTDAWDLRFRRFSIALNGGVSGAAGVEVTVVEGIDLEEFDAVASDAAWITDADDADDDGEPELAFDDWYDYDFMTHVLTPKPRVYVVRSSESALFALAIDDYYAIAGTSGTLRFRWTRVD